MCVYIYIYTYTHNTSYHIDSLREVSVLSTSEVWVFMRGEIVPPSKLIVTKKSPPRGGFSSGGVSY